MADSRGTRLAQTNASGNLEGDLPSSPRRRSDFGARIAALALLTLVRCTHPEPSKQAESDDPNVRFFNMVKRRVGQHWDPVSGLRQRDPTGTIFGGKTRCTILSVTLDAEGMLRDVSVEESCGVDFLDDAAVRAFKQSAPFPNPPPDLLAASVVKFQFGFFLEFGGPCARRAVWPIPSVSEGSSGRASDVAPVGGGDGRDGG
jgi:TonB family protein